MSTEFVSAIPQQGLRHEALHYPDLDTYLGEIAAFVHAGLRNGEPVLVALPSHRLDLVRGALRTDPGEIEFVDLNRNGRNPNLILLAVLHPFLERHSPATTRIVVEPVWPGRLPEEIESVVRLEARINADLAGYATTILCPYDRQSLSPGILSLANRTHPTVVDRGIRLPCQSYADPRRVLDSLNDRVPDNSPAVLDVSFDLSCLAKAIGRIAGYVSGTWLAGQRATDLVRAVTEVTSGLRPDRTGRLRLYDQPARLICEIRAPGGYADLLTGDLAPATSPTDWATGLFAANQLCDLVDTHTHQNSCTTRLVMLR